MKSQNSKLIDQNSKRSQQIDSLINGISKVFF
jgi:hypothetical protein